MKSVQPYCIQNTWALDSEISIVYVCIYVMVDKYDVNNKVSVLS